MSNKKKIVLSIIALFILSIICFVLYEFCTRNKTYYISEKNLQIPIFVYHDLVENEDEIEHDYMQTTVEKFKSQIIGLMKLGYKPISYKDLVEYKNGKKAISKWSFVITFDDGYLGFYKYVFEVAKELNIPVTSFAIDDKVGTEGFYNWEQAREMYDSGLIEIYSHGLEHIEYDKVPADQLVNDLEKAYNHLKEELKDENLLKVFTYPYGLHTNEQLEKMKEAGFIQNLTDNKVNNSSNLNLSGLHREYPLNDSILKIFIKTQYRALRYK